MTAYNDEALQTGVTGGGQFVGIPDRVTDPPAPKGNHGEYVSGAVKWLHRPGGPGLSPRTSPWSARTPDRTR